MRPDAKFTESPSNGRWSGREPEMTRKRPAGRWRQRKPETGDGDTSREHFIHKKNHKIKNKPAASGPSRGKAKGRNWRGKGVGVDASFSPPQHPSKPSYPAPQLRRPSPQPRTRAAGQPLTTTWCRDPGVPDLGTHATNAGPFPHSQATGSPGPSIGEGAAAEPPAPPAPFSQWDGIL